MNASLQFPPRFSFARFASALIDQQHLTPIFNGKAFVGSGTKADAVLLLQEPVYMRTVVVRQAEVVIVLSAWAPESARDIQKNITKEGES